MTKDEVIAAMLKGEKVTHRHFSENEWVTIFNKDENTYLFEDGVQMSAQQFWRSRCRQIGWDTDWEIFVEKNSMQKIIFLDIDGVLNHSYNGLDEFGQIFHKHLVDNLNFIIKETGAKIVISSTWRMSGLETMQRMWEMRDLPGEVIDVTPNCVQLVDEGISDFYDTVERGNEIQYWLDRNKYDSYVIIDDCDDMLSSQKNNFVKTSNNKEHPDCVGLGLGLTRICAEKAIQILNKK